MKAVIPAAGKGTRMRELPDALLAAGHKLAGRRIAGRWVDVRDPEMLASLETGRPRSHKQVQ